jgi:hypothetical protein
MEDRIMTFRGWLFAAVALAAATPLAFTASARPEHGKVPIKVKYNDPMACITTSAKFTESAATRPEAEQKAVAKWSSYWGSPYSWGTARNSSLACSPGSGGWTCVASGTPCTKIRNAL